MYTPIYMYIIVSCDTVDAMTDFLLNSIANFKHYNYYKRIPFKCI